MKRTGSLHRHLTVPLLAACGMWAAATPLALAQQTLLSNSGASTISVDNGRIYFIDSTYEFCTNQRVRSMSVGGGAVTVHYTDPFCPLDSRYIVADGAYLFTPRLESMVRFWTGGSSSAPATVVTPSTGWDLVQKLETEDDWVYWSSPYAVGRVGRDGSSPSQVARATTFRVGMTTPPNGFVYWTEGGAGDGVIKRASLALPSPIGQEIRTGLNTPTHLINDDTYLYWAEPNGVIRRCVFSPLGITTTIRSSIPGGYIITGMVTDATHIYWTESTSTGVSRIMKMPKGGGTATQVGPGNLQSAFSLQQDTDQLYWVEGTNRNIRRIRKDAAAITPDFSWIGLEVTQGIQNIANSVPIVQGKPTLVRGYARSTIAFPNVSAQLTGVRTSNGAALPGSPLRSSVAVVPVPTDASISDARRRNLATTFNWEIPDSWLGADVTLTASVNVDGAIFESATSNNAIVRNIPLSRIPPICLKMRRTRTERPPYTVNDPTFWPIVHRARTLMPARDIWVYPQSGLFEELDCCTWYPPFVYWDKWEVRDDGDWMIAQLIVEETFSGNPSQCNSAGASTHRVAMIGPDVNTGSRTGYGNYIWNVSFVKFTDGGSTAWDAPGGGSTLAHELSHNFNGAFGSRWKHVNCGGPDGINGSYPYATNSIGPAGATNYYGYDPISRIVISPTAARDYMSYCGPQWISDYNWRGLQNELGLSPLASPPPPPGDYLLVIGFIDADQTTARIQQTIRIPAGTMSMDRLGELLSEQAANTSPSPEYQLELRSGGGALVRSMQFDTGDQSHGDEQSVFTVLIQDDTNAPSVTVRRLANNGAIGSRRASANAPVISAITSPAPGQSITNNLHIAFTANDVDGDLLTYIVQYSNDNGDTWEVLAANTPLTSFNVDSIEFLPGMSVAAAPASCRIRIIASDGFNTAVRTSEPFRVSNRGPIATISEPRDGARFGAGESIRFRGQGYDPEEGQLLNGSSFSWQVTGLSSFTGTESLLTSGLAPGTYSVTLTARDARSLQGLDTITIYVEDGPTPPSDTDNDGVPDATDNCPLVANPSQADTDGDSFGDSCDNCPLISNPDQGDNNGNDVGNACDTNRLYVNRAATGSNNGLSWANAFTTLEAALVAADSRPTVAEIWIAEGTYVPTARTNAGDVRSATFRLRPRVSLRGGFVGAESSADEADPRANLTILSGDRNGNDTGNFGNRSDNVYTVLTSADGVGSDTVIDGLVISGGNAGGTAQSAVNLFSTTPTFRRTDFTSNQGGTAGGGAVNFNGSDSPTFDRCRFMGNTISGFGGAIYFNGGSPLLINCLFTGNTATGGTVARGGAVYAANSSPALLSCTLAGNSTTGLTGGVHIQASGNFAMGFTNSIVYFNTDSAGSGTSAQIRAVGGAAANVAYSCVQGGFAGPNISSDPLFTNLAGADGVVGTRDDQARPRQGAPTSDAGANSYTTGMLFDLDGLPRLDDDRARVDSGVGAAPIVDMGVYEQPRCAADFNRDAVLNTQDFFDFITTFFANNPRGDFNHDGTINSQDFFDFLNAFFVGC